MAISDQAWGSLPSTPVKTPEQRKAGAEATIAEGKAEQAPLDAEGIYLANQKKRRELGLPVLTPAQEQADKEFGKEYVAWRNTGGMPTLNRQLDQLQEALSLLRTRDTISGPVLGRMPKWIQQAVDPKGPDVRAQVEDVIQRSLRQILGAQFTQVEGERMISRAFDPEQQEQSNVGRLTRVVEELRQQGAAKEASSRFFEKSGTLQGFNQQEIEKVAKEFGVPNTPRGGQPWLSGDQEAVVSRYARGNPTAQGYADLLTRMAQEQGFEPDEAYRQRALEMGRQVEAQAQSGIGFGPGVQYLGGVPKPVEGERREGAPLVSSAGGPGAPPSGPDGGAPGGLSWGEALASAGERFLPNAAEVAGDTVEGLVTAIANPIDTAKSLGELAGSFLGSVGLSGADPTQADDLVDYLRQRYGSLEGVKRTFANEPAALALDLSTVLTAGGTGVAKAASGAGRLASAGKAVATAGRVIDPLSAAVAAGEGLTALARKYTPAPVKNALSTAGEAVFQRAPAAMLGFPSGVGGETIREAAGAGRSSGRAIGSTPRSEAFRGQQTGADTAAGIVNELNAATARIREAASKRYETEIAPITKDATVLDFTDVEKRLGALKPAGLGRYKTNRTPGSHAAWLEAKNMVDQHKALMAKDPATYGTPAALDQFRRELRDTLEGYAEGGDRSASRIATGMYHAVRNTIQKQAPDYSRVLGDYSQAMEQLDQINRSLRSGKNVDASVRRMQSILRRTDPGFAGELVEQADRSGALRSQLAGRTGSSYMPDRLRGALLSAQGVAGGLAMAPGDVFSAIPNTADVLSPGFLAGAAVMSPRLATSGAYRAGQAVGAAERGLGGLRDLYDKYPAVFAGGVAGVSGAERASEELAEQELMRKYGFDVTPLRGY